METQPSVEEKRPPSSPGTAKRLVGRRIPARVAAFTSTEPAADLVRLASQQEVDLLLIEGPLEGDVRTVLDEAPSDVALLAGGGSGEEEGAVIVPFGAAEHDWAALELGVWFATARGARLRLLGATADPAGEKRDASRVLASASLVVQQLAGVVAEPALVSGVEGVVDAAEDASLMILGFLSAGGRKESARPGRRSSRGRARRSFLVRRGPRPGALSPQEGLTRYTWSFARAEVET